MRAQVCHSTLMIHCGVDHMTLTSCIDDWCIMGQAATNKCQKPPWGFVPHCLKTWYPVTKIGAHCFSYSCDSLCEKQSYSWGKSNKPSFSRARHICTGAQPCHSTLMIHRGVDLVQPTTTKHQTPPWVFVHIT